MSSHRTECSMLIQPSLRKSQKLPDRGNHHRMHWKCFRLRLHSESSFDHFKKFGVNLQANYTPAPLMRFSSFQPQLDRAWKRDFGNCVYCPNLKKFMSILPTREVSFSNKRNSAKDNLFIHISFIWLSSDPWVVHFRWRITYQTGHARSICSEFPDKGLQK